MRLLVCGGRDYDDFRKMTEILNEFRDKRIISIIIHGNARGADKLAGMWAKQKGVHTAVVDALWDESKCN